MTLMGAAVNYLGGTVLHATDFEVPHTGFGNIKAAHLHQVSQSVTAQMDTGSSLASFQVYG